MSRFHWRCIWDTRSELSEELKLFNRDKKDRKTTLIFLIFVGTLAQKDHDVWEVVNKLYFRVWWVRVDLQVFERLAQLFFKGVDWKLTGWFPFLGGKFLGLLLLFNLAAAHAVRFKVAAEGKRLYLGIATIAA